MNSREECPMRHKNGNCLVIGGFCTSVNDEICNGLRNAYTWGALREMRRNKWNSVKDRLPNEKINPNTHDFEYVLCYTIFGDVRAYKYGTPLLTKLPHFWNGGVRMDECVTHWQYLPEPPKEVSE